MDIGTNKSEVRASAPKVIFTASIRTFGCSKKFSKMTPTSHSAAIDEERTLRDSRSSHTETVNFAFAHCQNLVPEISLWGFCALIIPVLEWWGQTLHFRVTNSMRRALSSAKQMGRKAVHNSSNPRIWLDEPRWTIEELYPLVKGCRHRCPYSLLPSRRVRNRQRDSFALRFVVVVFEKLVCKVGVGWFSAVSLVDATGSKIVSWFGCLRRRATRER